MRAFLLSLIVHFFSMLPISINRGLGLIIGRLLYALNIRERRTTERNLEICYPTMAKEERRKLAQRSMTLTFQKLETSSIWFRDQSWRESHTLQTSNTELFQTALDSDQGVIVLIPHFGNWEMAGITAGDSAVGTGIYREPKLKALNPLMQKGRQSVKNTMVPANVKGVMAILKALRRGEATVILPDQVPAEGGVYADFFGKPAYTMTLVHKLIQKTRPRVVMAYALPIAGGFELGFMEPDADIYHADERVSATGLNKSIEKMISLAPEHYQWDYKRFKHQEDGIDPYA